MNDKAVRIYVAGHRGLAGSAIVRLLQAEGYHNLILRTSQELDLTIQRDVQAFFARERPEYVFMCAAKVGGIGANKAYPASFLHENLMMQAHVLHEAMRHDVVRVVFLGSSCVYPKLSQQPIKEEYILTGPLEPTVQPYAIAKLAGIEMCHTYNTQYGTQYVCALPSNLYGPGDNYDLQRSHVLPALIRRMHDAKMASQNHVELWGTGNARREFLHSDDLADAVVRLMGLPDETYSKFIHATLPPIVNVGPGEDVTIRELATIVAAVVQYQGDIIWNDTQPEGPSRKLFDVSRMKKLGWHPKIPLREGIAHTYAQFLAGTETRGLQTASSASQ